MDVLDRRRHAEAWFISELPAYTERLRDAAGDPDATLEATRRLHRAMVDADLVGLAWPTEYGGQGLDPSAQRAIDEVARAFAVPPTFLIGVGFIGPTLLEWGTGEQRDRYLAPMLRADEIWCELFSEPGAGSDLASAGAVAVDDEGGWRITGQKVWTSGAHHSDYGLLLARTEPEARKHDGLSVFILKMKQPGVEVRPLRQITGATNFNEVFLDGAFVPHQGLVGPLGGGWKVARTTLMHERAGIGAAGGKRPGVVASDDLVALVRSQGAATHPQMREHVARAVIAERVAALLAASIKQRLAREGAGPIGSLPKLAITRRNLQLAASAAAVAGPHAAAWDGPELLGPWALPVVQAPSSGIAGGTTEVLKNLVGERVLGLPREPEPRSNRSKR